MMPTSRSIGLHSLSLDSSYPHRRVNYMAGTVEQFGLWPTPLAARWSPTRPTAIDLHFFDIDQLGARIGDPRKGRCGVGASRHHAGGCGEGALRPSCVISC